MELKSLLAMMAGWHLCAEKLYVSEYQLLRYNGQCGRAISFMTYLSDFLGTSGWSLMILWSDLTENKEKKKMWGGEDFGGREGAVQEEGTAGGGSILLVLAQLTSHISTNLALCSVIEVRC